MALLLGRIFGIACVVHIRDRYLPPVPYPYWTPPYRIRTENTARTHTESKNLPKLRYNSTKSIKQHSYWAIGTTRLAFVIENGPFAFKKCAIFAFLLKKFQIFFRFLAPKGPPLPIIRLRLRPVFWDPPRTVPVPVLDHPPCRTRIYTGTGTGRNTIRMSISAVPRLSPPNQTTFN